VALSVLDLFTIGIGPSSSHTVGPMRAARRFASALQRERGLDGVEKIKVELFGSLASTGKGHGSDAAVIAGLEGEEPERIDPDSIVPRVERVRLHSKLKLFGAREIRFDPATDLVFHRLRSLPAHPNGMMFCAFDATGREIERKTYYSVGGGFVVGENAAPGASVLPPRGPVPNEFTTAAELLALCAKKGSSIADLVLENECTWRSEAGVRAALSNVWRAMQACVRRGCEREGVLPGRLKVRRRAPALCKLLASGSRGADPLEALDWVDLWALAVSEENAAGGRVVTAPTNGAAGILPAVLHYFDRYSPGAGEGGVARFLLVAGAVGVLYKTNASISGAEVGCQGEVGVACSMAAAGLAEALGGSPAQVENAAEIGMEHNLGLTCDPVGGLVQVPCIERNAMGAVKAINACRIALSGDGSHKVSLDKVMSTMRQTGADMSTKYKETARGGLAVNIVEC